MINRLLLACPTIVTIISMTTAAEVPFENFITRRNDTLFDGDRVLRFISFNIPNLHLLEDDFDFTATNNWSLPSSFEILDALMSVQQAGGTVARIYCLRIRRGNRYDSLPLHVTAWRTYYEPAFRVMDTVLALAGEFHIRLIIPFLEGPPWWGPKRSFARLHDGCHGFESTEIRDDYRHLVTHLLNRRNTVTGELYKDDKTVLCWETGNEMRTSAGWLSAMAAFIKSTDPNHLIMDGNYGVRTASLDDPNIDIVSNHLYKKSAACIDRDVAGIKGRKVYIVGEWGWSPEKAHEVISRTIRSSAAGALVWSLRPHYHGGGFTWHKGEGLHWPGGFSRSELAGEREILAAVRNGAHAITGREPPPFPRPPAPTLLLIVHLSAISWQGSAGATGYRLERAPSPEGPWISVGDSIDETVCAYRPLFSDTTATPGDTCFYRCVAFGPGGVSPPSAVAGPVVTDHRTLVDELIPGHEKFIYSKKTSFTDKKPWRFKYDFHRRTAARNGCLEYSVNGTITAVRIYTFFSKKAAVFRMQFSGNEHRWTSAPVKTEEYPYCCADPHDRLRLPVLFSARPNPGHPNRRVRIVFPGRGAQVGRCEIDYKK